MTEATERPWELLNAIRVHLQLPADAPDFNLYYSAVARNALAALWGRDPEAEAPDCISLESFRSRIDTLFITFEKLADGLGLEDSLRKALTSDLCETFEYTGQFYWKQRWITPAMRKEAVFQGVRFLRGITPAERARMSGAGPWLPAQDADAGDASALASLFRINLEPLADRIPRLARTLVWDSHLPAELEFLQTKTSRISISGYWGGSAPEEGDVTLARTGGLGARQYFLCRHDGAGLSLAQFPAFLTAPGSRGLPCDRVKYLTYANAVLAMQGRLPPIRASLSESRDLVKIRLNYLPQPDLFGFFKLYSWPVASESNPNFCRVMTRPVYDAFKALAQTIGYSFKEQ